MINLAWSSSNMFCWLGLLCVLALLLTVVICFSGRQFDSPGGFRSFSPPGISWHSFKHVQRRPIVWEGAEWCNRIGTWHEVTQNTENIEQQTYWITNFNKKLKKLKAPQEKEKEKKNKVRQTLETSHHEQHRLSKLWPYSTIRHSVSLLPSDNQCTERLERRYWRGKASKCRT